MILPYRYLLASKLGYDYFMYLIFLAVGMCVAYVALFFLFPTFFGHARPRLTGRSVYSIIYILILCLVIFSVSVAVPDPLGNRLLHTFGGGFLAFIVCFLVWRDSRTPINRFQFWLLSFLIVIALGVANELVEFTLQNYFHLVFAESINDTWLDLASNTIGALLASTCLIPFVKNRELAKF
jgi:hypothetical protein